MCPIPPAREWWLADDPALPERAADAIANADTSIIVSAATAWEIAIKKATGRLEVPDDLLDALDVNDFEQLPITTSHAFAAGNLPAHHSDAFDRMLIAQAQIEGVTLASVDTRFSAYEVELLPRCPDTGRRPRPRAISAAGAIRSSLDALAMVLL